MKCLYNNSNKIIIIVRNNNKFNNKIKITILQIKIMKILLLIIKVWNNVK